MYTPIRGLHDLPLSDCDIDNAPDARTCGTIFSFSIGDKPEVAVPYVDLVIVLTTMGRSGALVEDSDGALADGWAMLPYPSNWAIRTSSSREAAVAA